MMINEITKEEAVERLKKARLPIIKTATKIVNESQSYLYDEFELYREQAGLQDWMLQVKNNTSMREEDKEITIMLMQREGWRMSHLFFNDCSRCTEAIREGKDYSRQLTRGRIKDGKRVGVFFMKNRGNDVILENEDGNQWILKNKTDFVNLMKEYEIPIID